MTREPREKRKLERSPLVVVLTEIRFAPILTMASFVPAIQDELRRQGYPGFTASAIQQFQFSMAGSEPVIQSTPRWVFTSKDNDEIVSLTYEAISMQTTSYDDFEAFLEGVRKVVAVIESIAAPSFADRVGLRYVDAVPNIGDSMADYFNETVLTFSAADLGVNSILFNQHIIAATDKGHLQIRMSQVEDAPLLPPDLNTPELAPIAAARTGVHAIFDVDSADETRSDFTWETLEERLWGVHQHASSAFWKSITPQARKTWGEHEGVRL
ncbi:TIGR04255 family protein [Arthrobacter sp.]|uniref:TIGR04255 family protein n=1 Tax=Arthrobacter sp. TaxID=1667 RepID=UPI0028A1FBFB|nr:TIGR04255 family protein [Arthrobacter sp.]